MLVRQGEPGGRILGFRTGDARWNRARPIRVLAPVVAIMLTVLAGSPLVGIAQADVDLTDELTSVVQPDSGIVSQLSDPIPSQDASDGRLTPDPPGTALAPGTVESYFAEPTRQSSRVGTSNLGVTLVETDEAFVYVSDLGNYTFPRQLPFIMSVSTPDDVVIVPASAFLIGSSVPVIQKSRW